MARNIVTSSSCRTCPRDLLFALCTLHLALTSSPHSSMLGPLAELSRGRVHGKVAPTPPPHAASALSLQPFRGTERCSMKARRKASKAAYISGTKIWVKPAAPCCSLTNPKSPPYSGHTKPPHAVRAFSQSLRTDHTDKACRGAAGKVKAHRSRDSDGCGPVIVESRATWVHQPVESAGERTNVSLACKEQRAKSKVQEPRLSERGRPPSDSNVRFKSVQRAKAPSANVRCASQK